MEHVIGRKNVEAFRGRLVLLNIIALRHSLYTFIKVRKEPDQCLSHVSSSR